VRSSSTWSTTSTATRPTGPSPGGCWAASATPPSPPRRRPRPRRRGWWSRSASGIADELYVSLNTVKTHIKSIYCKLDTNRRWDAVKRARQLQLL
jgi:hypothetical protein